MGKKELLKIRRLLFCIFILLAGLLMITCERPGDEPEPADPYAAQIDPSAAYQIIRGFGGATVFTPAGGLPSQSEMNDLFGSGDRQIGLSILRIRVASDDNAAWRATELNHALQAKANGAIVIATPWSPPVRMKSNGSLIDGTIKADSYEAYANYLNDFAGYMANNGAGLYAISVQNEPDISVTYESCRWTSAQMCDFLKGYGHLITNTKVIAPESFNFNQAYTNVLLDDNAAAANVDIVGGHIYGSGLLDYPKAREKSKELWMTEHLDTEITYEKVLATGKEIHDCMTIGQYNAYIWWYLKRFYGPMGEDGVVTKRGWIMANYAKFIRPGYNRIFATVNPKNDIYVSAYEGDKLIIVALNLSVAGTSQTFIFKNSTPGSYIPYTTSETLNLSQGTSVTITENCFKHTLPAKSITTFVVE
jgi:glucuronoarabinoxylan endo-1,4-beta-xylanase